MSRDKRRLSEDEHVLWARVAKTVKRSRSSKPAEPQLAASASPIRSPARSPAPKIIDKPPPANRANEKRVRRGKLDVGASLDLHGHTQVSGQAAVERFLLRAQANGDKVVVVITGIGRNGPGTLKQRLPEWLAAPHLRSIVSGYAPAHRAHGGAGAYYVFLRRSFTDP